MASFADVAREAMASEDKRKADLSALIEECTAPLLSNEGTMEMHRRTNLLLVAILLAVSR